MDNIVVWLDRNINEIWMYLIIINQWEFAMWELKAEWNEINKTQKS